MNVFAEGTQLTVNDKNFLLDLPLREEYLKNPITKAIYLEKDLKDLLNVYNFIKSYKGVYSGLPF